MTKRFDEVFSERIRNYHNEIPSIEPDNLRTQYWLELTEKLSEYNLVNVNMPHPYAWYCILLDDVPYSECFIALHAYTNKRQIKVSIIIEKNRQELFDFLLDNISNIENELGLKLDLDKNKGRRYIRINNNIDIKNKVNWPEAIDWQLKTAEKFKEVFNPRINEFYDGLFAESTTQSSMQNTISSDYFYYLANQIKNDSEYESFKELLVDRYYDILWDDDLKEKGEVKREIFSKINHYRFREKSEKLFQDIVDTLNDLKYNEMFKGDYLPYKALAEFYYRNGKHEKAIEEVNEFLNSDIHVNEIILSGFKFLSDYCHTKIGLINNYNFDTYNGHIKNDYPLCDQISHDRERYYRISDEKYEYNQSLILLLEKSISAQFLKYEDAIRFYVNLIDCDIPYFKAAAYRKLAIFCDRMNCSEKFYLYYMNAVKLKEETGNILQEDFDRIYSCKQHEIDYEYGMEENIEDQFNKLFSEEFRRK